MAQPENNPPTQQDRALGSYAAAIKAHRHVVFLVTLAAVLASVLFLLVRAPGYEATADLLIEPLPQDDQLFLGLPLLRDTGDPVRTVETAASLLASEEAADLAAKKLGGSETGTELLEDVVTVAPAGGSNILAITATADTADEAARIANEFARAALEVRDDGLREQANTLIDQLELRLDATSERDLETRATLTARVEQLRTVLDSGDPTMVLSQPAVPPTSAEGASAPLILVLALMAGLTLGVGTAIVLELITRRVRDEDELVALYPMPILARVPTVPQRSLRGPDGSAWYMPPEIAEPFRTLTVQLEQRTQFPSTLMVTSPTKGDGKTSSTINLAVALAATGSRVVVLDFDLRNPQVGKALGLTEGCSLEDLLRPDLDINQLLVRPSDNWPLSVLPVRLDPDRGDLSEPATWGLPDLITQAQAIADYVIVDTPPLGEVSDALRLVGVVDSVLIVIRPGNTNRNHLRLTRELLERVGRTPNGCIMVDTVERPTGGYYGFGVGGGAPDLILAGSGGGARPSAKRRSASG